MILNYAQFESNNNYYFQIDSDEYSKLIRTDDNMRSSSLKIPINEFNLIKDNIGLENITKSNSLHLHIKQKGN